MFIPSSDGQMTYKYYPYTFSTEQGYIDPNRSRVPSIMMTKRHQFAEFMPAIGQITIVNNKGYGQFNPGYAPVEWYLGTILIINKLKRIIFGLFFFFYFQ